MLVISQKAADALHAVQLDELTVRIAAWLATELPVWTAPPGSANHAALTRICALGKRSGMRVETDMALFALLGVTHAGAMRALLKTDRAMALMDDPDLKPASKLLWLEDQLRGQRR
jgi:hypothetical protein